VIPFVEDYLSELIHSKFEYMKNTPGAIGKILDATPERLAKLEHYLQTNKLNIIRGYPRTPAELPSICILLSGEGEVEVGLGDTDEGIEVMSDMTTVTVPVTMLGGFPFVTVPSPVDSIISVLRNTDLTIVDTYNLMDEYKGLLELYGDFIEGDLVDVTLTFKSSINQPVEVLYESNYRIEVWTMNGDLTVELYHLTKGALLSGRGDLLTKGLVRQKLGGADFQPAPNFFPEFVYRRALTFWSQFIASVPGEDDTFVQGIELGGE
jgi:hypothetical protein